MTLENEKVPSRWSQWRNALWWPAVILIFLQISCGLRDLPQSSFFLIYLQEQMKLPPVTISSVVACAQVAGMLTALLSGSISARLGGKRILVLGLILGCVNSFVFQVHELWAIILLWFTGGVGLAMVTVGGASYLTRISQRGSLGILAALYALSMTIGGAIGNPLMGWLIESYGFVTLSWAAIGLWLTVIIVVAALMPPLPGQTTAPVPLKSFFTGIFAIARQKKVRQVAGLRCLPTIFYGMLTVLIPLILNDLSGSKVLVAAYGTTNLVIASGAQLLTGRAADRWGARRPTLVAYSGIVAAGLGLTVFANSLWGAFAFGVLGIASAWALSTLMYIWVNDGVQKSDHPSTFGFLHAIWSLSMISGSVLGGWFVTTLPGLPFLLGALLNIGSFFLTRAYYAPKTEETVAAAAD